MSFRTRLTGFFVLIVMVPMLAVGFLVFRLIGDSEQGKADARANGLASEAASIYEYASRSAQLDAQAVGRDPGLGAALAKGGGAGLRSRLAVLSSQAGLARVVVLAGSRTLADVGDQTAIAPGVANVLRTRGRSAFTVKVSTLTATQFAGEITGPNVAVVVRSGGQTLGSTLPGARGRRLPAAGTISIGRTDYRAITLHLGGFYGRKADVTVLSDLAATHSSVGTSRAVAGLFIAAFLLLAVAFSILASRALQGQLSRFLAAAKRLGGGDFSSPVPTEGRDEFAALGAEFNSMSRELKRRIDELGDERARLRDAIRRIGETFASNLDRQVLLDLALRTARDAVRAECGRLTMRTDPASPLSETARVGSLDGLEEAIQEAESDALARNGLGTAQHEDAQIACLPMLPLNRGGRVHGLITVVVKGRSFSDEDHELLRSLASQATLALENIELHHQVQRQAVTDELTGLTNHGRFQELLSGELEQVRRYQYTVGLIMLDVDDFKAINDSYGHQQGDIVLRNIARVVRESSRETDWPARYGGEEMAVILPHTDLEGSYAIAERVRTAIEDLRVRRLDGGGVLRITASLGVVSSSEGDKQALIAAADGALYEAKRQGKNRTLRASAQTANVFSAE